MFIHETVEGRRPLLHGYLKIFEYVPSASVHIVFFPNQPVKIMIFPLCYQQ